MLVKLIPGLEKYAMDSSNVTLLLLVVLATIVIKDIFEQKKLLKEYEAFIIFQLYGKRNDAVSITLDEYFSALPINEIIDKIKAELDKQSSEKDA